MRPTLQHISPRTAAAAAAATVVLVALAAGCAGDSSRRGESALAGTSAEVDRRAYQQDTSRCPRALPPGRRSAGAAIAAARRQVDVAFRGIDTRRYLVVAAISLASEAQAYGIRRRPYFETAARDCGAETARRSWVVLLTFPNARSALINPAAAYVVRTEHGWRVWYRWSPFFGGPGEFV